MIVCDHDVRGGSSADDTTCMVDDGEVDVEAELLLVMAAIAGDAHGQRYLTGGQFQYLGAIEVQDACYIFVKRVLGGRFITVRVIRIRVFRFDPVGKLLGNTFRLGWNEKDGYSYYSNMMLTSLD